MPDTFLPVPNESTDSPNSSMDDKHLVTEKLNDISSTTIPADDEPDLTLTQAPTLSTTLSPTRSRRPTMAELGSATNLPASTDAVDEEKPKEKWTVKRVFKVTWAYVTTVKGFLITVYMLNVVAWGGMLFLLICNAAPAMCTPTCNALYSPRRIWIEIDSQILNALFCVTGIGLLPWRLRDGYLLFRGRWPKLSKIHAGWYIDGVTRRVLMWWVVCLFLGNSVWQIAMAVTMWSMNRFQRPGWVTGVCITASFLCAIFAGAIEWWEVRRRKKLQKAGKVAPPLEKVKSPLTGNEKGGLVGDRDAPFYSIV